MSATGTDIRTLELRSTDGRVTGAALVEVENLAHLQKVMKAVRRVKGIVEVARRETGDVGRAVRARRAKRETESRRELPNGANYQRARLPNGGTAKRRNCLAAQNQY